MIPVMQTRFFDSALPADQPRGNCLQAVIASMLELPLDEVPHFVQIELDTGRPWWIHMVGWLGRPRLGGGREPGAR